MNLEDYPAWLKRQIALYEQYEKEDLEEGKEDAAYKAKLIADTYRGALNKFNECE